MLYYSEGFLQSQLIYSCQKLFHSQLAATKNQKQVINANLKVNFSNVLRCAFQQKIFLLQQVKVIVSILSTNRESVCLIYSLQLLRFHPLFISQKDLLSISHRHTSPLCLCAECSICSIYLGNFSLLGFPRAFDKYFCLCTDFEKS